MSEAYPLKNRMMPLLHIFLIKPLNTLSKTTLMPALIIIDYYYPNSTTAFKSNLASNKKNPIFGCHYGFSNLY